MLGKSALIALLAALPMLGGSILSDLNGTPYWYNGDPDAYATTGALPNGDGIDGQAGVWDDFNVGPGGATITGVFSVDALYIRSGSNSLLDEASWQILNGPPGTGSVVAGDATLGTVNESDTVNVTDTGSYLTGAGEMYTIEVTGLDINLAQGTYYLLVAPLLTEPGNNNAQSYIPTTAGVNGVGSPQAQDGSAYYTCTGCSDEIDIPAPGSDSADNGHVDFSMGVEGTADTPEPGTLALVGAGLIAAALTKRRKTV